MENIRNKQNTVFGYGLNRGQNAILNHLVPCAIACFLYVLITATDVGVIFRHYKDNDPIWASLTLFVMYLPAIGSFILIITDCDYWPEPENGMTNENAFWLYKKILGHLLFPLWNIWRFAERIFWSIEAARSTDEDNFNQAILKATESRLIELYVFLQAYLHSLPQVLLQLHILMRHNSDIARESKNTQALCILLNLAKVAVTTTHYQRFKAQKLTGSKYPWLKQKKIERCKLSVSQPNQEPPVTLRRSNASQKRVIENERRTTNDDITRLYDIQPAILTERRRSSDIYLEPDTAATTVDSALAIRTDDDDGYEETFESTTFRSQYNANLPDNSTVRTSYVTRFSSRFSTMLGVRPMTTTTTDSSNVSFNVARIKYQKGLREDDVAGKTISFLWWFTFLLSRVLAISVFAYFFFNACVWLLLAHVVLVVAVLAYDAKTDHIKRDKAVFFLFIGVVYVFCIIELKIRFKKTTFIYFGYFGLVYLENCLMCVLWYCNELESLENDYWFRYIFYVVVISDLFSLSSMIFYHILTKPKSVPIRVTSL